jgi:elongation factor Tu
LFYKQNHHTMPEAKPHFNIIALGYRDHGKTTLTDAIAKVLKKKGQTVVQTIPQKENGVDISMTHNAFQTEKNDYTLVDCARRENVLKYITTHASPLHGAILVVSSADGYTYHVRQQLAFFSSLHEEIWQQR